MTAFNPELGQLVKEQYNSFDCPAYLEAALKMVKSNLDRVLWNTTQETHDTFESNDYSCDVFEVQKYSWTDEEQLWNFRYKADAKWPLEVSWYKHFGRSMSCNKEFTPDECAAMLDECIKYINSVDVKL
jgi:hypothetical protein